MVFVGEFELIYQQFQKNIDVVYANADDDFLIHLMHRAIFSRAGQWEESSEVPVFVCHTIQIRKCFQPVEISQRYPPIFSKFPVTNLPVFHHTICG